MATSVRGWSSGWLIGATLALLVAGCSGGTSGAPAPSATAGKTEALLRPVVTAALDQMRVPGANVYVAVPGQDPWQVASGVRAVDE